MDTVVQLETLAALTNLTLSPVVAGEMVAKYRCIPFFLDLVSSTHKPKHTHFAGVCVCDSTELVLS